MANGQKNAKEQDLEDDEKNVLTQINPERKNQTENTLPP